MIAWYRPLIVMVLFALPCQAWAERYALLVGVSQYPTLEQSKQLSGPREDMLMARTVLQHRGFSPDNITVLADGVPGSSADPTRQAIAEAFERLARTVHRGDYVFILFAGHGSQEPADRSIAEGRSSVDGLFRIFLPRDVGHWLEKKGVGNGSVINAIADHEFRRWIDRLTEQGAFVWAIFDACHSATLVRGGDPDIHYRGVDPAALGIPARAFGMAARYRAADHGATGATFATTPYGRSVFFYAAQTTELAPEKRLPADDPDRKVHGLFTFTILRALERQDAYTYRQLAQQVFADYQVEFNAPGNFEIPTPLFSGTQLDAPIFGDTQAAPVVQWPINPSPLLTIPAGELYSITPGTVFALLPNALARDEDAIGYLRAQSVSMLSTTLVPAAFNGRASPRPDQIPTEGFARIVHRSVNYSLRVAAPPARRGDPPAIRETLARLQRACIPGARIIWQTETTGADVRLMIRENRLWLLPPSGQLITAGPYRNPSLALDSNGFQDQLQEYLRRIARTVNLVRIAAELSHTAAPAAGMTAEVKLTGKNGTPMVLPPDQVTTLRDGDQWTLTLTNSGRAPIDVTGLYIDSQYGIRVIYPDPSQGESNRLNPGAQLHIPAMASACTVGLERLLVIGVQVPERAEQERYDLSFLAQPTLINTRSAQVPDNDILATFREAGFAEAATRGGSDLAPERTQMAAYLWRVQPGLRGGKRVGWVARTAKCSQ